MDNRDVSKFKAAVLYILNKQGYIDQMHLFKILYFADREHLAKYGRKIIPDDFFALPDGPVPTTLYDIIKRKQRVRGVRISEIYTPILNAITTGEGTGYYYIGARELPDMDELSQSDIETLDKAYEENISLSYGDISRKSHAGQAWKESFNNGSAKKMDMERIAKDGGATDEMIAYIREMNAFENLEKAR